MVALKKVAKEGSTYVVKLTFYDEDGALETPVTAQWTLTDMSGAVVNSRKDVVISGLATSVNIVLSGADLTVGASGCGRVMTVEGTYNSTLGSGLPFAEEVSFTIEPSPELVQA